MRPRYYPKNRKPQKEEIIPFSLKYPIELKSATLGSSSKHHGPVCVYELSLLLACLKETSYSQIACATEIGNFQKCFYTAKKGTDFGKKTKQKEATTGKNTINDLLKKYSS